MANIRDIQSIPTAKLIPYANNAKLHPAEQIEKIAKSIEAVGFISPILIDSDCNVIAGHGRLEAAKRLNMKTVPCVSIEGLSEEQRRAYILMDNRLSELGSWDMDLVYTELGDLDVEGFDIDLTGFDLNVETDSWFDTRTRNDNADLGDESEEYQDFVGKFEQAKTTDDCYTPDGVYAAVADWVCNTYGVQQSQFVRPFVPGGDYQGYMYKKDAIVVDNPPFSILSEILRYYTDRGIKYFLFAPAMTPLSSVARRGCTCIAVGCGITYENGARVPTSFLTNLDDPDIVLRSAPDLYRAVQTANDEILATQRVELPKYEYPGNVVTAAMVNQLSKCGAPYALRRGQAAPVRELDAQKEVGKAIFGSGFLISEKAAAEKAAAEKAAAEKAAAEKAAEVKWPLSEREQDLIRELSEND